MTIPNVVNVLDSGLVKVIRVRKETHNNPDHFKAGEMFLVRRSCLFAGHYEGQSDKFAAKKRQSWPESGWNLDGAYFCLLGKAQLGAFQMEKMSDIERVDLSRL